VRRSADRELERVHQDHQSQIAMITAQFDDLAEQHVVAQTALRDAKAELAQLQTNRAQVIATLSPSSTPVVADNTAWTAERAKLTEQIAAQTRQIDELTAKAASVLRGQAVASSPPVGSAPNSSRLGTTREDGVDASLDTSDKRVAALLAKAQRDASEAVATARAAQAQLVQAHTQVDQVQAEWAMKTEAWAAAEASWERQRNAIQEEVLPCSGLGRVWPVIPSFCFSV
jgi:hypothetical protein